MGILGRKDFLKLAGAAGIGVAAGAGLLQKGAGAAVTTDLEPTDFVFTTREQFRPFDLLARNFVRLDDDFDTDTTGDYSILRPGPAEEDEGSVQVVDGTLQFTGSDDYYTILKSDTGQRAPYATVIIDVAELPDGGTVYAGLYKNGNNYVHAYYDKDTNTVGLEAEVGGDFSPLGSALVEPALEAPFRFAFVVNENEVTALVDDGSSDIGDFRPLIKRDVFFETEGALDLRLEVVLSTYKNGFGARVDTTTNEGGTVVFDHVQAGYFGEAGCATARRPVRRRHPLHKGQQALLHPHQRGPGVLRESPLGGLDDGPLRLHQHRAGRQHLLAQRRAPQQGARAQRRADRPRRERGPLDRRRELVGRLRPAGGRLSLGAGRGD